MSQITALALFSGGLDSILACRVVAAQGIRVVAVKFVTPFFDYELLASRDAYQEEVFKKYGIEVLIEDLSDGYLDLLHNPQHGFGKNFNPCIDCKILMITRARAMMTSLGASFLVTGEVLGQRPMSQRRDTLQVIERDSGAQRSLLRPLSARLLPETEAEAQGWIDRSKLLNMSGRGRSRQIALAREFGIVDFPSPAGGCILADPILSRRIARIYQGNFVVRAEDITVPDICLLLLGRQFLLPGGGWLILGRNEQENARLLTMAQEEDAVLFMPVRPGPSAILRRAAICYENDVQLQEALQLAAALVVRFGKKIKDGPPEGEVQVSVRKEIQILTIQPLADKIFKEWALEKVEK
ncbi:MAG: thiamine biosynthesis protein [Proteobacteria bacterium]|nr:thiamine biosynthesis protein [Desulfocapsa sp.]MBU3943289.1 thiamine biosynthesis protein [Pseudomonadota bacterium]MCG2744436.1 thiamine biosynthesis protein [Desulfobacteraceae bacterium]MBU3982267.1 thiamine biosynthesis protein [Pseudomonadota bacterium]MBU4028446.1 thiamine biosynthesis protein [Pseudomonadota bacterium]